MFEKLNEKEKRLFKGLSLCAFVVSGIMTTMLFVTSSTGILGTMIMFSVAVIYEVSKWSLLRSSFTKHNNHYKYSFPARCIMLSLWGLSTMASVVASAGLVINEMNATKNMQIEYSTAYQNQVDNRKLKQDLYNQKKAELSQLHTEKSKIISDMEKNRDAWGRDYITMKENAQAKINSTNSNFQAQIIAKSSELTQIAAELDKPIKVEGQLLETAGYSPIFKLVADMYNKNSIKGKKEPMTAESIELWFFLILGIGLECFANVFAYMSQIEDNNSKTTVYSSKQVYTGDNETKIVEMPKNSVKQGVTAKYEEFPDSVENTTKNSKSVVYGHSHLYTEENEKKLEMPEKPKTPIGFQYTPSPTLLEKTTTKRYIKKDNIIDDLNDSDVQRYLQAMYKYKTGNKAPGVNRLARELKMKPSKAVDIKNLLERKNIIKTINKDTIILKKVI